MAVLHPSETPPLGWLVPCLAVTDLEASLAFHAGLGLLPFGGDPHEGWSMLRSGTTEVHLFAEHIDADVLNFRGGDVEAIGAAWRARGLEARGDAGFAARTFRDPDGRDVFLDTSEEERAGYLEGRPLTLAVPGDPHETAGPDLGEATLVLDCADEEATAAFYRTLGLVDAVRSDGRRILGRADDRPAAPGSRRIGFDLALRTADGGGLALAFRGGDVAPGGSVHRDPDGRRVIFA